MRSNGEVEVPSPRVSRSTDVGYWRSGKGDSSPEGVELGGAGGGEMGSKDRVESSSETGGVETQ